MTDISIDVALVVQVSENQGDSLLESVFLNAGEASFIPFLSFLGLPGNVRTRAWFPNVCNVSQ